MRLCLLGAVALLASCAVSTSTSSDGPDAGVIADAGAPDAGSRLPLSCLDDPPADAPELPPLPTYNGTCPVLQQGMNTIRSSNAERSFILALPADLQPGERPPVLFMWHWLKGTAQDFYEKGQIQMAADQMRFIAVLPNSKGDTQFTWPFTPIDSQARTNEDIQLFDDLLACVGAQFSNINRYCVASAGVSAGALWTDLLIGVRSEYLSSFISLSGGTGGQAEKPFKPPTHKIPGIVLWGGPTDYCGLNPALGLNFQDDSGKLETALKQNDQFFIECVHNCGHQEPPVDPNEGMSRYAGFWQFVFDHPYWLPAGFSPYQADGIPPEYPPWCGVGKGSATPRTGMCGSGGCN